MGTLPDVKLPAWLIAVIAAAGLGFLTGRYVGESELRYLLEMPPSDGVTQGMGIHLMPRFGIVASKLDQNRVHFLKVPDPATTRALASFPKLAPPPVPQETPKAPEAPAQEESHDKPKK